MARFGGKTHVHAVCGASHYLTCTVLLFAANLCYRRHTMPRYPHAPLPSCSARRSAARVLRLPRARRASAHGYRDVRRERASDGIIAFCRGMQLPSLPAGAAHIAASRA